MRNSMKQSQAHGQRRGCNRGQRQAQASAQAQPQVQIQSQPVKQRKPLLDRILENRSNPDYSAAKSCRDSLWFAFLVLALKFPLWILSGASLLAYRLLHTVNPISNFLLEINARLWIALYRKVTDYLGY